MKFNKNILREADIRGIYPDEVNSEFSNMLGKVFGTFVLDNKGDSVVVGHDNRFGGPDLTKNLIEGLISTGVNVHYIGLVTTPMLNYASRKLANCYGVMVTASHNPTNYNGFKLFGKEYQHCSHEELDVIYNNLINFADFKPKVAKSLGHINFLDIDASYAKYVQNKINPGNRHLKVVIDCGNGTASTIVRRIYDKLSFNVTYIYSDSDPRFPNHHPDPNVKENLVDLCKKVVELHADIGLAYDGDADRIGVVDEKGHVVDSDIMMAIMTPVILKEDNSKPILIDVKCSNTLRDTIKYFNGTYIETTPSSAREEQIVHEKSLNFGGGFSNHIFFHDSHPGYDDGIYAGLRFHEYLTHTNSKLSDLEKSLPKYFNTEEIKVKTTDVKKWKVVAGVKEYADLHKYTYETIDGIKIIKKNSWALVRASNTGPNLTLRFEATTKRGLKLIQNEFMEVVGILNQMK